ncbi:MAG: hypothetical protein R3E01_14265 [Pirellulaceae bacterium]|nr:sodium:calcium antiporter [Planctomycetales bacterium]
MLWLLIVKFAAIAAVVVVVGGLLTRYADQIAETTGIGRSMSGFLLLAAATSLPELTVNVSAVMLDAPDLAVGDLMGSSIFNLLILGMGDFVHRSQLRIFSPISAAHSLSAIASIVLTSIMILFIVWPGTRLTIGPFGLGSILIAVAYVFAFRLIFQDQRMSAIASGVEPLTEQPKPPRNAWIKPLLGYLGCTVVIFIAGQMLAKTAEELAEVTGLGSTFVGTTLVGLTTSLPEFVTTFAALRMGAFEMAVGNIFGSNCFNMATLVPLDFFYRKGDVLAHVGSAHVVTGLFVITITGVATMGIVNRAEKKYWFVEPDAALVIALCVLGLGGVYLASR